MIYNLIGRMTVKIFFRFLRRKVDPRTAALAGVGVVVAVTGVGVVAYLATREVPEA